MDNPAERMASAICQFLHQSIQDSTWGWVIVQIKLVAAPLSDRKNVFLSVKRMPDENYRIVMEHQLIVKDDKGCRTYPLMHSDYEIGKSPKLPIRLYTQSPLVAPVHATLVRLGQVKSFHYQLIASFSHNDSGEYKLLVNGTPIQTHYLHDGNIIEFVAGISAIYRYSRRVEPLTTNFSEGFIDFSYYGLGNLFA